MGNDCATFKTALETSGKKTRKQKGPCHDLTTGLLRVSKQIRKRAAEVLYSKNVFDFPCASAAWMQLESFLATTGSTNVGHLRNLRIHVPLWHRGVQEDYVEGAILDLTSPASRLGVVKPVASDRLLSAVRSSTDALRKAHNFETLGLGLEHGITTDRWTGRYSNDKQLLNVTDAE